MPRYISLDAVRGPLSTLVRPLAKPIPVNPILTKPSPHQYFASLPSSQIPPNVRIEWEEVNSRRLWQGVSQVERYGGRKSKDWGKDWRIGKGREARKKGGLQWALREK